jgi:gliding motility-associated-like protein
MNRKTSLNLLVVIVSFCYNFNLYAQSSCIDTTSITHYRFKGTGYPGFTVLSADNSLLLGTALENQQTVPNSGRLYDQVSLLRVRINADTAWSKKIIFPSSYTVLGFAHPSSVCIGDQNEKYLLGFRNFVTSVDTGGHVLSSKKVTGKDSLTITNMVMAPDGDKILLLDNGGWEQSVFMMRVSADLSVVRWVKNIEPDTQWNHLRIWKLVLRGNEIACVGYHDVNGRMAMILGFDYNSGQLLHSKSLKINGRVVSTFAIEAYDSGYIVHGSIESGGIDGFAIIKLDTAFNIRSVYRFKNISQYGSLAFHAQNDGGVYCLYNDAGITYLLHVNNNNILDLQTYFALWYGVGTIDGISIYEKDNHLFFTLAGNTPDIGINNLATYLGVYKSNLNGYVGSCNIPNTNVGYEPIDWANVDIASVKVKNDSATLSNFSLNVQPLTLKIDKLCSAISTCNSLKIIGDTNTCTSQVRLTGRRNPQCRLPVKWTVLEGSPVTYSAVTDSATTINFTQAGNYKIEASIAGSCSNLADTIVVHVSLAATTNLGKDTSLCNTDSLLLRLNGSFKSITWQDGSSNLTFNVKQPGTYFVQAEAVCGGISRDTIVVTQRTSTPLNIGADRTKCNNDTIQLNAPSGFIKYNWSPAYNISSATTASVVVNPSLDTAYSIKAQNAAGCFSYDTVKVKVLYSAPIFLGNDTSFCAGPNLLLNAGNSFASYKWSDGSTEKQIRVSTTGTYTVKATTAQGCKSYDTINVNIYPLPIVSLNHNTSLCFAETRILDAGNYNSYNWHNGSTNRTFAASGMGTYYVSVVDVNGCAGSDTTRITTTIPLPSAFLPADTSVCSYGSITTQSIKPFTSYLWNTNQTTRAISISQPGTYWLKVKDNNTCEGIDSITVTSRQCTAGLFVPTAFTPNKDGKNDFFKPLLFGLVKSYEFAVAYIFGQTVFKTKNMDAGWNGSVNGIEQQTGVFVWYCFYQLEGQPKQMAKGTVVLLK